MAKNHVSFGMLISVFLVMFAHSVSGQEACTARYNKVYNGTCMRASECQGALFNNQCKASNQRCCVNRATPTGSPNFISLNNFLAIVGDSKRTRAMYKYLQPPSSSPSCWEVAAYISELAHETQMFELSEEVGSESYFSKYDGRYGNDQPGDGAKYRGRGFIQLTFKGNYKNAGASLGVDLVAEPELVAFPYYSGKTAQWFWQRGNKQGKNLNVYADGTFYNYSLLTDAINGGSIGLVERTKLYEKAGIILGCGKLQKGFGLPKSRPPGVPAEAKCRPSCISGLNGKDYCGCSGTIYKNFKSLCERPSHIELCEENCTGILDLTFVVDSSSSIGEEDFQKAKDFIKRFISGLNIRKDGNGSRVAIINFSSDFKIEAFLNTNFDTESLLSVVDRMIYFDAGTGTAAALEACQSVYTIENGMRDQKDGVTKLVLVLTDGASNNLLKTIAAAKSLKQKGILIHSIGIGSGIFKYELIAMSSFGTYYLAENYAALNLILDNIIGSTCNEPAQVLDQTSKIEIGQDSFRYFQYSLENNTEAKLGIYVDNQIGKTKLFASFDRRNPNDFQVFPEEEGNDLRLSTAIDDSVAESSKGKLILKKPENATTLYIGVKGLKAKNTFTLRVGSSASRLLSTFGSERTGLYLVLFCITWILKRN